MSTLRHGPPLAMNGFMDKEGRKLRGRKTRYFKLRDSALFNHRRKDAPASWGVSLIDSRVAVGHKGEVIVQLFDGKKILVFPHTRHDSDMWVDLLQRAALRKISNYYGVTGLIGMGSFAEVRIGYDKVSGDQVAIKVMKKNKRDTELMRSVECEMNFISKNIDHENIVKTYDVFDARDNLFIVMEYMPGGMLYDILAGEGHFSEKHAAAIMRDLLEAVHCLHSYDIVHRDIKPENVLAVSKTFPLKVKLADFGLADFVLENSFGQKSTAGMYGTPFFVAPEVIRAETYTPAVDIWSLGVLAYNMLSGQLPFDGSNIKDVLRKVRAGRYAFPDSEWGEISDGAKSFIRGLLELNPETRLTAAHALAHPWLNSDDLSERAITNDRSALGYDQRKLRMSSMAIDDVAALLDMDDEDEDDDDDGPGATGAASSASHHSHNLSALSRLFPGRASNAKPPSARSSPASSRSSAAASRGRQHHAGYGHHHHQQPQHHHHQELQPHHQYGARPPHDYSASNPPAAASARKPPLPAPTGGRLVSGAGSNSFSAQGSSVSMGSGGRGPDGGGEGWITQSAPVQPDGSPANWRPRSSEDLLPPLHPLAASGKIQLEPGVDSLGPEDLDPFDRYAPGMRPSGSSYLGGGDAAEDNVGAYQKARSTSDGHFARGARDRRSGGRYEPARDSVHRTSSHGDDAGRRAEMQYREQRKYPPMNAQPPQPPQRRRAPQGDHEVLRQELDPTGYRSDQIGGFEASPGFALPAIVSVQDIRNRKAAVAAAAAGKPVPVPVSKRRNNSYDDDDSDEDEMFLFQNKK